MTALAHLDFGDPRRGWNFRSPGRGQIDFDEIFRALNHVGYRGPLSVEWEDNGMDREQGAPEGARFVRGRMLTPSDRAFDLVFTLQQDR
jgi:sugar phosphate isomerase/epimerase